MSANGGNGARHTRTTRTTARHRHRQRHRQTGHEALAARRRRRTSVFDAATPPPPRCSQVRSRWQRHFQQRRSAGDRQGYSNRWHGRGVPLSSSPVARSGFPVAVVKGTINWSPSRLPLCCRFTDLQNMTGMARLYKWIAAVRRHPCMRTSHACTVHRRTARSDALLFLCRAPPSARSSSSASCSR